MKHGDNEALQLFIEESREHLAGIEEDLLVIEKQGEHAPAQTVDKVFRAVHTIKGGAGFFAFERIKELSHAMENVLGKLRSSELIPTSPMISALLDGADALRSMINSIDGSEDIDISAIVVRLDAFIDSPTSPTETTHATTSVSNKTHLRFQAPVSQEILEVEIEKLYEEQQRTSSRFVFLLEIDTSSDSFAREQSEEAIRKEVEQIAPIVSVRRADSTPDLLVLCISSMDGDILVECLALPPQRVSQVLTGRIEKSEEGVYSLSHVLTKHLCEEAEVSSRDVSTSSNAKPASPASDSPNAVTAPSPSAPEATVDPGRESSLRVNIKTLDRLMTLAGEMVLTRNELLQNAGAKDLPRILSASQRVDSITSELQEAIMSTRMQSIGIIFGKFRRIVRDLSMQLGKQVHLEIEGEDVELDKSIIEAVGDPLTHIIRNSVDHGLESSDVRLEKGKPSAGSLLIKARHEAGQVVIEITDDGKGIDPSAIRKKAAERGVFDETTLAGMSDREVVGLVFKPGFSTAEKVTDVSGRGVGMDVVQSNLKKVGGAVDIDSKPDKGTTIRIKLPLTLAIIPSLMVTVEDEYYAIPQVNLVELVRIPAAEVKQRVEMVGDAPVMRLRGELLPLVRVSDVLGITERTYQDQETGRRRGDRRSSIADRRGTKRTETDGETGDRREDRRESPFSAVCVAVVVAGDFKYGLIVDVFLDTSEIVVKPLGYHLCECREYAGATILGDGRPALILDVVGIRRLLEMEDTTETFAEKPDEQFDADLEGPDRQSFLVVENAVEEYFAIPVGLISRIEKVRADSIQTPGGAQVIPYRRGSLRLFSIEQTANVKPRKPGSSVYVVIYRVGGREVGIITSEIIDTVEVGADAIDDRTHVQTGIIGSTMIRDRVTLVLDLFGLVRIGAPELYAPSTPEDDPEVKRRILIVEDSGFFRRQIRSFMEDAGYECIVAEDGVKGLAVLKNDTRKIDLVLTDIEMPNMNGLELTQAIREDTSLSHLPVIAVTSMSGDTAEKTGRDAGIDEYLIKLDREAVLAACRDYLHQEDENNYVESQHSKG